MKFLDESLKQDYLTLYCVDLAVFFLTLSVLLFILLECIFYEGSFKISTPHIVFYYISMFSFGYLLSRYLLSF